MKRGRANVHNIVLTYQPGWFNGTCVKEAGWVARWKDGENGIVVWSRTRKGAYSKAYRFMKECKR